MIKWWELLDGQHGWLKVADGPVKNGNQEVILLRVYGKLKGGRLTVKLGSPEMTQIIARGRKDGHEIGFGPEESQAYLFVAHTKVEAKIIRGKQHYFQSTATAWDLAALDKPSVEYFGGSIGPSASFNGWYTEENRILREKEQQRNLGVDSQNTGSADEQSRR